MEEELRNIAIAKNCVIDALTVKAIDRATLYKRWFFFHCFSIFHSRDALKTVHHPNNGLWSDQCKN